MSSPPRPPGPSDDWSAGAAHVGGEIVPIHEARIPILDWGFLRGDATYDVAHVWDGGVFRLEDHLRRFCRGISRLRMEPDVELDDMREILLECVARSGLRSAYLEMVCTRGVPPAGSRDPRQTHNRFYAFAVPFVWIATPEVQRRGLKMVIARTHRIAPEAVDPTVKNYHWLDFVRGLFEAYDRGHETVVLRDEKGHVIEGPGFNIFAVRSGDIITPKRGVLQGITRKTVIELAPTVGLGVVERPLHGSELRDADEIFITSTAGGVMPVTYLDGCAVGDGMPGRVTEELMTRYWDLHEDPAMVTPVPYADRS